MQCNLVYIFYLLVNFIIFLLLMHFFYHLLLFVWVSAIYDKWRNIWIDEILDAPNSKFLTRNNQYVVFNIRLTRNSNKPKT
jgi:hypothetical protein